MNELQVLVQQTPGVIKWNFEDLKQELATQMEQYKTIVYTDENIGDAKKDVASLRKLSKAVDARRIEIKNKCLEPYQVIEDQAKELKTLIGEPIDLIAEKIDDYETRRKAAKKEKIIQTMAEAFEDIPKELVKKLECKIYDTRWENAGTADKVWKEAIQTAHDETLQALNILKGVDEDFRDQVMEVYNQNLDFTGAMVKAQELARQKELLIERERQREEQERIRKEQEEKRKAEEAARAEAKAQEEAQKKEDREPEEVKEQKAEAVQETAAAEQEAPKAEREEPKPEPEHTKPEQDQKIYVCMLRMKGTADLIQKAINYARYIGLECEVQR